MARTSLAVTRPADRRAEILEAAGRLFAERGFHVTSTRDICVAVGMSAGNLYHWFPSKQAIIAELLRADAATHLARIDALGDIEDLNASAPDAILGFVGAATTDEVSRLLEGYATVLIDPELAPIVRGTDAATRERLASLVAGAGAADPDAVAVVLVALVDGLLARRALEPGRDLAALRPAIAAVTQALFAPQPPR
jgi:TetR/AcrR family transcriptional repressor of uid operon